MPRVKNFSGNSPTESVHRKMRTRPPSRPISFRVQEPEGTYKTRRKPRPRLQVLALEEHNKSLHNAMRMLASEGCTLRIAHDERLLAAEILHGKNTHYLLLVVEPSTSPLRVPQLIEGLRQLQYDRAIRYCAKEVISSQTQTAYENLTVDQVLKLPSHARRSILTAIAWLDKQGLFDVEGLSILECV